MSEVCTVQSQQGLFWHGPFKDAGACWGAAGEAWLFPSEQAAREALRGLRKASLPSADKARVVFAPAAALVGLPEAVAEPERRVRIKGRGKL